MDDEGKYIRETTYEKNSGGFVVGIDLKNQKQLIEMGKLVEKKMAKGLGRYQDHRIYYWAEHKLL